MLGRRCPDDGEIELVTPRTGTLVTLSEPLFTQQDTHRSPSTVERPRTFLRLLGVYEVAGGVGGVGLMGWLSIHSPDSLPWGSFLAAASPFSLVAVAGVRLLQRRSEGFVLSLLAQLLQVSFWSLGGTVWKCCAGVYVFATIIEQRASLSAGLDVTLLVGSGATGQTTALGVNLVPALIIAGLIRYRRVAPGRV